MILVIGTFRLPASSFEAAGPLMASVIAATRAEDGCLTYAYARDVLDAGLVHVTEKWRDRAALEAHFQTPHMAALLEGLKALAVSDFDFRTFESDEGTPL